MDELLTRTIEIIASHVAHNSVPHVELPDLIRAVHGSLETIVSGTKAPVKQPKPEPAVAVKKSVHYDYLVSLETGERFQTLRRHLAGLGMTPDDYRAKWGLAADYPMTAKGYSERRSALAKSLGLGRKPSEPVDAPAKVSKPHSKATVAAKVPTTMAESVQEPAEAPASVSEVRSNTTAPVKAEALATVAESVQEPAEAIQEAA